MKSSFGLHSNRLPMKLSKRRNLVRLPFDDKAERAMALARLVRGGMSLAEARRVLLDIRAQVLRKPLKAEKCEAKTRRGTPCQAPAGPNGRCKLHGGKSTGAKTPDGQVRVYGHVIPKKVSQENR